MNNTEQKIIPCLWYDDQGEEAADFYTSLFEDSGIGTITRYTDVGHDIHGQPEGKVMTIEFELAGRKFVALNGGPYFTFTPAISLYVVCETEEEVDNLWGHLSEDGEIMMKLGKYNWSDKYGWVKDRYGLTWQIALGKLDDVGHKITPSLMYVSEWGKAEEAINLYTSLFKESGIDHMHKYEQGGAQPEGTVKHARFHLNGESFMAMDTAPRYAAFKFNEAFSLLIRCGPQEEIDHFWKNLSAVPNAEQCGWLKDKFGVSWQVAPTILFDMFLDPDPEKVARVTEATFKMKKIEIQKLEEAYNKI